LTEDIVSEIASQSTLYSVQQKPEKLHSDAGWHRITFCPAPHGDAVRHTHQQSCFLGNCIPMPPGITFISLK